MAIILSWRLPARATSSFPFAFEPIKLEDVGTVLNARGFVQNYAYTELRKSWDRFHKDYNRQPDSIDLHSFGDGGYLDNKPFSYITETLRRRRADTPVDRRLFYIEPAPEHQRPNSLGRRSARCGGECRGGTAQPAAL